MIDTTVLVAALAVVFISFLLGSVPYGLIISKLVYHKDIRNEGSGNIGTTNAMRSLGKVGGIAVFLLDFAKGVLSSLIALWICDAFVAPMFDAAPLLLSLSFAGCTCGHIFSPWLHFKGGKGIAVAVGSVAVVYGPLGALILFSIFLIVMFATRYVSVGSMTAAICCALFALYYFWGYWLAVVIMVLASLNLVAAHHENISRLSRGCENRIGQKKKEQS